MRSSKQDYFSPIKGRQVRLLVLFLISHTILSLLLTSHCIIFIVVVSNFPIRMAVVHLEFPSNKTNKVTNFFHQIYQFFVCKRCFHIVIPIDFFIIRIIIRGASTNCLLSIFRLNIVHT